MKTTVGRDGIMAVERGHLSRQNERRCVNAGGTNELFMHLNGPLPDEQGLLGRLRDLMAFNCQPNVLFSLIPA